MRNGKKVFIKRKIVFEIAFTLTIFPEYASKDMKIIKLCSFLFDSKTN